MTNTNTKEFMTKVQTTILEHFDDLEALKNEIKNYINNFSYKFAKTMVEYGCFDCYYSQVAETMAGWFDCSVDEIWQYYKDDEQKLWNSYINIIAKNLRCIANGKRVYIN